MSRGFHSGQEMLKAIDDIIDELDRIRTELDEHRTRIGNSVHQYSTLSYWMSHAHSVLGNALALGRQVREWL